MGGAQHISVEQTACCCHADCGVETATGHWKSPILQVIESKPALLHVLLRQLYAHSRCPSEIWRPKLQPELPGGIWGRLGVLAATAAAYKVKQNMHYHRIQLAPSQQPQPITSQTFCQTTKGNSICFLTYYLAGGSRPLCKGHFRGPSLQKGPKEQVAVLPQHHTPQQVRKGMPWGFESSGFSATRFENRKG